MKLHVLDITRRRKFGPAAHERGSACAGTMVRQVVIPITDSRQSPVYVESVCKYLIGSTRKSLHIGSLGNTAMVFSILNSGLLLCCGNHEGLTFLQLAQDWMIRVGVNQHSRQFTFDLLRLRQAADLTVKIGELQLSSHPIPRECCRSTNGIRVGSRLFLRGLLQYPKGIVQPTLLPVDLRKGLIAEENNSAPCMGM